MTSWQGKGAGMPFSSLPHDQRVRVRLQSCLEELAVFLNQRKSSETIQPEPEQHQPDSKLAPSAELAAFVDELELLERLDRGVM